MSDSAKMNDLSKLCRTKQWIAAIQPQNDENSVDSQGSTSSSAFDVNVPICSSRSLDGHEDPVPGFSGDFSVLDSPVTNLATQFSHHHLEGTPRRRLSLDCSSSDSSLATPKKFLGTPSPPLASSSEVSQSQSVESAANDRGSTASSTETLCFDWANLTSKEFVRNPQCVLPSFSLTRAPESAGTPREFHFSGVTEMEPHASLGSSGFYTDDDMRSPEWASVISPAPSSVFYEDSDTRDSGFSEFSSGCKSIPSASKEFLVPTGLPPHKGAIRFNLDSPQLPRQRSLDDGFSDGFMEEVVQSDDNSNDSVSRDALDELMTAPIVFQARHRSCEDPPPSRRSSQLHLTPSRKSFQDITNVQQDKKYAVRKSGLSLLLGGKPKTKPSRPQPGQKRTTSDRDSCLELSPVEEVDKENSPPERLMKRRKSVAVHTHSPYTFLKPPPVPSLQRCFSETEVTCPAAAHPHHAVDDEVGDGSRSHSLPFIQRPKIGDLKCISAQTLADLLRNKYDNKINKFELVDCRYPYEYDGGHIAGAVSCHVPDNCKLRYFTESSELFRNASSPHMRPDGKVDIIIFYCEFSQQRGPNMCRQLRSYDRFLNEKHYPQLYYPELYLLEGGYKNFFQNFSELCQPQRYVKMTQEREQCKKFRAKSKSCSLLGGGPDTVRRPGLSRGLFR